MQEKVFTIHEKMVGSVKGQCSTHIGGKLEGKYFSDRMILSKQLDVCLVDVNRFKIL